MLFLYKIKRSFEKTQNNFLDNVKLMPFEINVLVESDAYLDKESQNFNLYFKINDKDEFLPKDEFMQKINSDNISSASSIANFIEVITFLEEIEKEIIPKVLDYKDMFYSFKIYSYKQYQEEKLNLFVNSVFYESAKLNLKYDYIKGEFEYNSETLIIENKIADDLISKYKYISIYDIEFRKDLLRIYFLVNYEKIYSFEIEEELSLSKIKFYFNLIGKSFKVDDFQNVIKNLENKDITEYLFYNKYEKIDLCKQLRIREIGKIFNTWLLFSNKTVNLPTKIEYEPTIQASIFTKNFGNFVGVKDIFALSNKIKKTNFALKEFKEYLTMR